MKIYITHCSAKKNESLANSSKEVFPTDLYTAKPTQRFMRRCSEIGAQWGIFSDHYGIWLANEKRKWYGDDVGDPNRISDAKFQSLVENFDNRLAGYDK